MSPEKLQFLFVSVVLGQFSEHDKHAEHVCCSFQAAQVVKNLGSRKERLGLLDHVPSSTVVCGTFCVCTVCVCESVCDNQQRTWNGLRQDGR